MKKFYVAGICALLLLTMTACGNQIPEMTEEEYAMVTEYAANKILQYSGNYHSRLVDTTIPPSPTPTPRPTPSPVQDDASEQTEEGAPGDGTDAGQSEMQAPSLTIAQVLGLDGFDITYTGYSLCDSYPNGDEDPENMFFAMSAAAGSKLLILNIEVTNPASETRMLDTLSVSAKYKVILNGQEAQNALVTMLEDDFTALRREMEAGETTYGVVVAEISEESAGQLQSVGLEIKSDDRKTVVTQ